ncbi:MAG: bifunctional phosphoribosyl-AMP cyclohydrolase/phosphoribosyl-ATP diphosphatase HisIE [Deltaproteobacteria bacterium]|nr:bifunctional phosphoribosyl-AMP cyclohydrolase/phosphoribosyl-ATP diphosphatase HisIE [Deltaproteobacteria bacterium]
MTPALTDALLAAVSFDDAGLVPVIAQDISTGGVRMFAWANRQALQQTATTGFAHFWSRSRQALWRKGESSGNVLHVRDLRIDCDGDVILYLVDADGPSCHTGHTSCFFRRLDGGNAELVEDDGPPDPAAVVVKRVADVIALRRRERPEKSYVVGLLDAGWPKVLGKISEESGELVEALPEGDAAHTAHEAADLLFHVLVGLEKAGVPVDEVFSQLQRRFGVSGLVEKASRGSPTELPTEPATESAGAPSGKASPNT